MSRGAPADGEDWSDQERPTGAWTSLGEIGVGALVAVALQAALSALLVAAWAARTGAATPDQVGGPLSCAACGQFLWLFPAFLAALWWRPGFAAGLAFGAMFGAALGVSMACLYAVAW